MKKKSREGFETVPNTTYPEQASRNSSRTGRDLNLKQNQQQKQANTEAEPAEPTAEPSRTKAEPEEMT